MKILELLSVKITIKIFYIIVFSRVIKYLQLIENSAKNMKNIKIFNIFININIIKIYILKYLEIEFVVQYK